MKTTLSLASCQIRCPQQPLQGPLVNDCVRCSKKTASGPWLIRSLRTGPGETLCCTTNATFAQYLHLQPFCICVILGFSCHGMHVFRSTQTTIMHPSLPRLTALGLASLYALLATCGHLLHTDGCGCVSHCGLQRTEAISCPCGHSHHPISKSSPRDRLRELKHVPNVDNCTVCHVLTKMRTGYTATATPLSLGKVLTASVPIWTPVAKLDSVLLLTNRGPPDNAFLQS